MKFSWDERKARRNERLHGVSFTLAERAILRGLGVPIDEHLREGEWRTIVVAPLDTGNLITIVVAIHEDTENEHSSGHKEQDENIVEAKHEASGRIISARNADSKERDLYFAHHPKDWF